MMDWIIDWIMEAAIEKLLRGLFRGAVWAFWGIFRLISLPFRKLRKSNKPSAMHLGQMPVAPLSESNDPE